MDIQKNSKELYAEFRDQMAKIADVKNAIAVLSWDQETYLPGKGAGFRGQQITTLSTLAHEMFSDDKLGNKLQELLSRDDLDNVQKKNVELSWEDYSKNKLYPASFVAELSQVTSESYHAWIKARKDASYAVFQPLLEKMISLKKQECDILGFEGHPYNALINEYEKGMTTTTLDQIFDEVKSSLSPFLQKIAGHEKPNNNFLKTTYGKDAQWQYGLKLLNDMGFDFEAGRQDLSEHPFTTSFNPRDVRVTTRVDEQDFNNMTWSCIHEGGHALYEQGLPVEQYGLPCGEAASLGVHESQSRLWENNVGRGISYWKHYYPGLQELFPGNLSGVPLEEFYRAINLVEPSLLRTEADEITYHFHVMIRYEIEKGLIDGSISAKDLNHTWNEYYKNFLQVTVPNDTLGVLQDIHWSHGSFGYFPTYSLGSFYAAQFYQAISRQIKDLEERIANGDFATLLQWLRQNIHVHGRFYTSNELCEKITGEPLNFSHFMKYAEGKYGEIYRG